MDHLFEAGKLLWFMAAPSNLIFGALIAGALLLVRAAPRTRLRKAGAGLAAAGIAAFILAGLTPLSQYALRGLERTWPPFDAAAAAQAAGKSYAGIILLGGAVKSVPVAGGMRQMLGEGGERIRYTAQLARAFPDVPVFIAAGTAFPRPGMQSEAEVTAAMLEELGIDRSRLHLDSRSRNTVENARQVKALQAADAAAPGGGCYILVTSAFHMKRAAAIFRGEGISVAPAPTDWRADPTLPILLTKPVDNLAALDLAAHEFAGLAAIPHAGGAPGRPDACPAPTRP